uniref:Uncharacterized protein n=1 Tax=Caenorhabditis japonica TaxID=281687 RepID=A0A8R1IBQ7_CAEJA
PRTLTFQMNEFLSSFATLNLQPVVRKLEQEEEFVPLSPVRKLARRAAPIPKRSVKDVDEFGEDIDPATATVPPDVEVNKDSVRSARIF